jgi:symplekin
VPQIQEILAQQGIRMDKASAEEKKRKALLASGGSDTRKRPAPASAERASEPKRAKLEPDVSATSASFLASFDFTSLPAPLITDLIVANIEAFSENALVVLVQAYRQSRGIATPATVPPVAQASPSRPVPAAASARMSTPEVQTPVPTPAPAQLPPIVKDEPVDPLQMDIDQDELEYEPDRLNKEV